MSSLTFHLADLWETVADTVPDRTAVVCGDRRLTFRELDERASRLAGWMSEQGVGQGSFVGLQMTNAVEYVESMLAAFKLRAAPVNVNYRFTEPELRHLYEDAGLQGVVHDADLAQVVANAARGTGVGWTLARGPQYELIDEGHAPLPRMPRSDDDLYVLYTGGTTGHPKGVVWRIEDAFFACIGGGDPRGDRGPIERPDEIAGRVMDGAAFLPAAPLIHAAGMWTTLRWLLAGAKVVLLPAFDARLVVHAIATEGVTTMNIVGDAMAMRLAEALEAEPGLDLPTLSVIASGGARLAPALRARLLAVLSHVTLKDSYGSSETGVHGWSVHTLDDSGQPAFRTVDTVVLDPELLTPMPPQGTATGLVARANRVPLRYHNDPKASAATFVTINGVRHAVTGDMGILAPDGTLTLLGRGSQCINSGGEKIFPEEVEATLCEHPDVRDALVVGLPDPVWGQRVTAVVEMMPGRQLDPDGLRAHSRATLAGFKVPKSLIAVPSVHRTPAGKPDYRWATSVAAEQLQEAKP
ncbi:AMP-binding protein [Streptomyces sp. NPDC001982]|uniref:AMP-binding protein n=1 Tax=Streptomyces sp. NPDC001982 TaxID=3154405 RepID=UPI00332E35E5